MNSAVVNENDFKSRKISVYEPFSDFLLGTEEEKRFDLTLLDIVRFAGHACPSMVGAFLISQRVIKELFPDGVCVRGEIEIDIPSAVTQGATGPISNVFGFIFGAWGETGFGGLKNQFVRRGLMRYSVPDVPAGAFRFRNVKTGACMDVFYNPNLAPLDSQDQEPFQLQWRRKIKSILEHQDAVLKIQVVSKGK
jgi:hypothetical protein